MKRPLTFVERNSFAIYGSLILALLIMILAGLLFFFKHTRDGQEDRLQEIFTEQEQKSENRKRALDSTAAPSAQLLTGAMSDEKKSSTASPPAGKFIELHLSKAELEYRVESGLAVLHKFMTAPDVGERARFVHDAARVTPAMRRYYETEHLTDPKLGRMKSGACYSFEGGEMLHLVFAGGSTQRDLEVALRRREGDTGYLIDWESFAGESETGWNEVQQQRPTMPVMLRVLASVDDYYNYEFSDDTRYLCIKLESAAGRRTIYAYCLRESPLARSLLPLFGAGRIAPLTVRIAFPMNAKSSNCVELKELVANRWLLP